MRDIFYKLMHTTNVKIYELHNDLPFLPKGICYSHKKFKASNKPCINFEKKFIESLNLIKKIG